MFCKSHLHEIFNGNLVMADSKQTPSNRDPLEPYPKADPRMIKTLNRRCDTHCDPTILANARLIHIMWIWFSAKMAASQIQR